MKSYNPILKIFLGLYLVIFFGYLLGPLIIMGVTAFNSPGFPRAAPFECLTFEWFDVLYNDKRIINGIKNSLYVGTGTVILSVILGLAGALMLTVADSCVYGASKRRIANFFRSTLDTALSIVSLASAPDLTSSSRC